MQAITWVRTQALSQTDLDSNPKLFGHWFFDFEQVTSLSFSFLIPKIEIMITLPLSIVMSSIEIIQIKFVGLLPGLQEAPYKH